MHPHSYSDEGIVLGRRSYGEADRIISVYTQAHGRVALMAKGIRKVTSRKRGHLEIFSQIKFQATNGYGLDLMTEVETINNFGPVRKSLAKSSLAYYFMEAVGRTTHEGELHPELYYLLVKYLSNLTAENKLKTLKNMFVTELLVTLGFWPKGEKLAHPDLKLEEVTERNLSSLRVGKRVLN